ncbi:MAG TPA: hypothetical protein VML96_00265, partial [Egibacteraceae bacterium]|nr:hypothetical protein [Egibacteraceae bacterium]
MARRSLTALALLLTLASCGAQGDPQVRPAPGELSPSGTASASPGQPSDPAPTPNAPATATPTGDATPAPESTAADTLDDGRPATFLAVTDDFEAVEVDTASAAVLRSLGQMDDRAAVERAEVEAATNVIGGVWRTGDASWYLISECCEPAGGAIHRLRPSQELTPETHDRLPMTDGWHVTPLPGGAEVLTTGYITRIGDVGGDPWFEVFADELMPASPG